MKVIFEEETVIAQTPDGEIILVEDREQEQYYVIWAGVLIWKSNQFDQAANKFADVIGDWSPSEDGSNPYLAKNVQVQ
jgi:hypothetical protein